VAVFSVNVSLVDLAVQNRVRSYTLTNSICAAVTRSAASPAPTNITPRSGQVNGLDSVAGRIAFTPLAPIWLFWDLKITEPIVESFASNFNSRQVIDKFTKSNQALLFVTMKGESNGEPNDGWPAAKDGSVGHGRPQNWSITANNASTESVVPIVHFSARHRRRCVGARDSNRIRSGGSVGGNGEVIFGFCTLGIKGSFTEMAPGRARPSQAAPEAARC
jgi:hypothetical protein